MLPVHAPPPPPGHAHTPSGSSIASFADFVSAPGRSRRFNQKAPPKAPRLNITTAKGPVEGAEDVDEVLFDEEEMASGREDECLIWFEGEDDDEEDEESEEGDDEMVDDEDHLDADEDQHDEDIDDADDVDDGQLEYPEHD